MLVLWDTGARHTALPQTHRKEQIMDESMVFENIKTLAVETFSLSRDTQIEPDTSYADLGLDSLDAYELLMAVEEKFDITLPEENLENISTLQDMVDLVMENL